MRDGALADQIARLSRDLADGVAELDARATFFVEQMHGRLDQVEKNPADSIRVHQARDCLRLSAEQMDLALRDLWCLSAEIIAIDVDLATGG